MRILLADDQKDVCSALRILLEQEAGMNIEGEASSVSELLLQTRNIKPDLLLLDWELPNLRSAEILSVLKTLSPGTKVVAMSGRPESRKQSLIAGADAFVSKCDQPDRVLETIRKFVKKGEYNENRKGNR